ncbi:MAG: FliA/WhiG family RNA polymerase sigma factor [Thermodesulfobacteriota bacterium]
MKANIQRYRVNSNHEHGEAGIRDDLIVKYGPMVKYIVDRMAVRFPPNVSKDELVSAGILGLFDALDKFDSEMGIKFQTYAEHRIKGAILDELRKMDWLPRSVRKDIHRLEAAITALRMRIGRDPDDIEIAQEMKIDIQSYYRIVNRARGVDLLSLDDTLPDGSTPRISMQASGLPSPLDELEVKEVKTVISRALSQLSKKEQLVVSLYYQEELTLKEIAKVLDLTESRISQIHTGAIVKLRAKLKTYYKDR